MKSIVDIVTQVAKYIPLIVAGSAILFFAIAYTAHIMFGTNNVIERASEKILNDAFDVHVEFLKND